MDPNLQTPPTNQTLSAKNNMLVKPLALSVIELTNTMPKQTHPVNSNSLLLIHTFPNPVKKCPTNLYHLT